MCGALSFSVNAVHVKLLALFCLLLPALHFMQGYRSVPACAILASVLALFLFSRSILIRTYTTMMGTFPCLCVLLESCE
jgi:hypothetical protein